MAGNPYTWTTTASTNDAADTDINWAEGQTPSSVNNSARGMMAGIAGWLKDTNATLTTGGSANTQTVTGNIVYAALSTGLRLILKAGFTNTAACTLNLTPAGGSAFGSKSIKVINTGGEADPLANAITANGHYIFEYDAAANGATGAWILLNPAPAALPQLTALTSGIAQTYSVPAGARYLMVEGVGPGGPGAGSGTNATSGTIGTATTFGTLTGSPGGVGSTVFATTSTGGAASNGDVNLTGGDGQGPDLSTFHMPGGNGGGTFFGAGGNGGAAGGGAGIAGKSGTGSGGGGGGIASTPNAGGGGAGGGYFRKLITSPLTSYTYTVGASTTGGNAGTGGAAGGAGASGLIIVTAYFS